MFKNINFHVFNNFDSREQRIKNTIQAIKSNYENKLFKDTCSLIKNTSIRVLVPALEEIDDINIITYVLIAAYKIKIGQLFNTLNYKIKVKIIKIINRGLLIQILDDMNSDDVVNLIEEMPIDLQKKIILSSTPQLRSQIKKIRSFGDEQIGRIMNTTFFSLKKEMNIKEALILIRNHKNDFDINRYIYVVTKENILVGKIKPEDLFFASNNEILLEDVMDKSFSFTYADDDIDDVVKSFKDYQHDQIAVVNKNKELIGIIEDNDIIPALEEETTEKIYRLYGISDIDQPYIRAKLFSLIRSRILWLSIMMISATLTTLVIDQFQRLGTIYTAGISTAILVPIIPVITGTSGNAGSQSTASVIRALATGDITNKDFFKVFKKELKVSFFIGMILFLINFIRLLIYFAIFPIETELLNFTHVFNQSITFQRWEHYYVLTLMGTIGSSLALWIVVILAKLIGGLLPFLAIKLKLDPVVVSTPILSTILDALSSAIFFGIGILILHYSAIAILNVSITQGQITLKT